MPTVLLCTGHLISRDYRCSSKLGRKDSSQRTLRSAISTWLWLGLIDGRTDWLTDRLPAWVKAKPFLRCWLNSCLQKDLLSCTERGSCPGWAMNTAHEDEEWQQIKVYGTIVNGPKTSWPGPPKGCAPFTAFFLAAKDYFRNGLILAARKRWSACASASHWRCKSFRNLKATSWNWKFWFANRSANPYFGLVHLAVE